jgi:hypothetical protein
MIDIFGELYTKEQIYEYIQYYKNHQSKHALTQNIDTDKLILYDLDELNLYHTCQTNKYLYNICVNDPVLRSKVNYIKKFINKPIDQINNFTPTPGYVSVITLAGFNPNDYNNLKFSTYIIYRNMNGLKLHLYSRYDYDKPNDPIVIYLKGPLELTENQLFDIISIRLEEYFDNRREMLDYYGDHLLIEGFYKNENNVYLQLT